MSVYQHQGSPFYQHDFQLNGSRFHGSTGCTNKREAEAFERDQRTKAKQQLKSATAPTSSKLDDMVGRYWHEVGQHHAGSTTPAAIRLGAILNA